MGNHKLTSYEATQQWEINMQMERNLFLNPKSMSLISSQGESPGGVIVFLDKCQGRSLINGQIISHNSDAVQLVEK